uniref:LITAF domain-containing protein n=1 Tax=Strongyloides stercoralis TaxID=6248 RepID=A0A0K0E3F7_STRER
MAFCQEDPNIHSLKKDNDDLVEDKPYYEMDSREKTQKSTTETVKSSTPLKKETEPSSSEEKTTSTTNEEETTVYVEEKVSSSTAEESTEYFTTTTPCPVCPTCTTNFALGTFFFGNFFGMALMLIMGYIYLSWLRRASSIPQSARLY